MRLYFAVVALALLTIVSCKSDAAPEACSWTGYRCHCAADQKGSSEGYIVAGLQCLDGQISDFKIMTVDMTHGESGCPKHVAACSSYSHNADLETSQKSKQPPEQPKDEQPPATKDTSEQPENPAPTE